MVDFIDMGIFAVKPDEELLSPQIEPNLDRGTLKIVLFLCKSEKDRFLLESASITVCGNFFCWSFPEEKVIHLIDMSNIHKLAVQKREESFVRSLPMKLTRNLSK